MNRKQQEDAALENIKEEYGFDEIKDAFDEAAGPHQLDIFWGENNENFIRAIEFLSPSIDNREFIAFLSSEKGQNVMTSNSFSIHIESGNISTRISIQLKIFTVLFPLNRTMQKH